MKPLSNEYLKIKEHDGEGFDIHNLIDAEYHDQEVRQQVD